MKVALTIASVFIILNSYSQELSDAEKEGIRSNVSTIPADSALTLAKNIILSSYVTKVSNGNQLASETRKAIYIGLEILKLIEAMNLKNDDYYSWRAMAHEILGNNEQAIVYYSRAIDINPKHTSYYKKRGECKRTIENYYGAISDFTKAIGITPHDDSLYGNRAFCHIYTKQWDNAMLDANKAISMNRKEASYYLARGIIHHRFDRLKEACLDWNTAGDMGDKIAFEMLKEFCRN